MISESTRNALPHQLWPVCFEPGTKRSRTGAGGCPIPAGAIAQATIDLSNIPPAGPPMLSEVHRQKYQPERLIYVASAVRQHRGFQGIEANVVWITAKGRDVSLP